MKIYSLLFLLSTTVVCCTYPDKVDNINRKDVTGRFVFQANNRDTIDVNSDGTYSNYKWEYGQKLSNSGTWIYDSLNAQVSFQDFYFLTDTMDFADSTFVPRGSWNTKIVIKNNEIQFIYATDISNGYFLRIDTVDRKIE